MDPKPTWPHILWSFVVIHLLLPAGVAIVVACGTVIVGAAAATLVSVVSEAGWPGVRQSWWLPVCVGIGGLLGGLPAAFLVGRWLCRTGPMVRSISLIRDAIRRV